MVRRQLLESFVIAWAAAVLVLACEPLCGNTLVQRVPSPGGRLEAVVFVRDCGATTGVSTHVSVLGTSEALPNRGGNTAILDDDHGSAPAGAGGGPAVEVSWQSASALLVRFDSRARVFRRELNVRGVTVKLERVPH